MTSSGVWFIGVNMALTFLAHNSYPASTGAYVFVRANAFGDKIMRSVNLFTPINKKFILSVAEERKPPSCGMLVCKTRAKVDRKLHLNPVFLPPKSLRKSPNVLAPETESSNKDVLGGLIPPLWSAERQKACWCARKTAHALI